MSSILDGLIRTTDDGCVNSVTVSTAAQFAAVVEEVKKPVYDYRHTWNITLASGFNPTLNQRWNGIRCSLSIVGGGTEPSTIYFSKSVVTEKNDDCIISIFGASTDKRVSVRFENLKLMPVGATAGTTFSPSASTNFGEITYLIKIYYAKRVDFVDVESTLANGKGINLDLRTCDNVTLLRCEFTNDNGIMTNNREGGIICLRGSMDNVMITDCTFTKYGNDEILWFAKNSEPHNDKGGLTTEEKAITVRRNIRIANNKFHYRRPSNPSGVLYPSNTMDVMITLDGSGKGYNVYWENVLVTNNEFKIEDRVRRIIWVQGWQETRETQALRIFGNKIIRKYTDTSTDPWSYDFWLSGDPGVVPNEAVEIAQNEITIATTVNKTSYAHACVYLKGVNANVHDNLIDASGLKVNFTSTASDNYKYEGFIPFVCETLPSVLKFTDNRCLNVRLLGRVQSIPDNDTESVYIARNYAQGQGKLVVSSVGYCDLRLENNFFRTNAYELMLEGSSLKGSIWANGNVWDTYKYVDSSSSSVILYYDYSGTSGINLNRATFIGNVVTGTRTINTFTLPKAESTVIANNSKN